MSTKNTAESLWSRVQKAGPDDCWLWCGPPISPENPYGRISISGRSYRVHRVAYELAHGEIPKGRQVNHHCDQPLCCNPAHLYAGTQADNLRDQVERDRIAKGNQYTGATHCVHGHEFTEENTYRFNGDQRGCRTCRVARTRAWRSRKAEALRDLARDAN